MASQGLICAKRVSELAYTWFFFDVSVSGLSTKTMGLLKV